MRCGCPLVKIGTSEKTAAGNLPKIILTSAGSLSCGPKISYLYRKYKHES